MGSCASSYDFGSGATFSAPVPFHTLQAFDYPDLNNLKPKKKRITVVEARSALRLINVKYPVKDNYYKDCELNASDIANIPKDVDLFVYTYATGSYEGTGEALMRFGKRGWAVENLGHCSCYGPTDSLSKTPDYKTLAMLRKASSTEALRVRDHLILAVKRKGRRK